MKKYFLLLLILLVIMPSCKKTGSRDMKVYPVPGQISAARGGEQFIALQVELPQRSHIYGNPKGPGTGKPTRVDAGASSGFILREQRFLPPKKFYFSGEKEYTWGYEDETRIFIPFTVRDDARTGIHNIEITFDALLCSDSGGSSSCIPKVFRITCPVLVVDKNSTVTVHDESIMSDYKSSSAPPNQEKNIIKKSEKATGVGAVHFEAEFPGELAFSPRYIDSGVSNILQAILFGVIAGFLLNFMPCVLPVVSLKVMNFVQHADKSRKELFFLGLLFSLGILTSFAALASLAAFFGYKWGGLFQHRLFLVIMTGIIFALALSMFGVFVLTPPAFAGRASRDRSNFYADAYIKGLLATLLATPCSGPFLGATLAWTFSQPPAVVVAVFMCVGLGMALPYMILTINPGFLKYIPKPGEWLNTFEKVMGFMLMFTVIYLLGVFDRPALMPMITFLGFTSVGLWQYGKYGAIYQPAVKRVISLMVLAFLVLCGYFLSFDYLYSEREIPGRTAGREFSMRQIMENRETGKISVIEFTAEWCPNCKLVEKASLNTSAVAEELGKRDIDFMVADITVKNRNAERLMALFHSGSIPLLAIVPPGKSFSRPIILRDIYSKNDVLKAIDMARKNAGKINDFNYQFDLKNISK
jgi:thiol:disulfide interchange protein